MAQYVIDGIIGLPILNKARKVAWVDNGKRLLLGNRVSRRERQIHNLYWHESGFGLISEYKGNEFAVHFDSGANRLSFFTTLLNMLDEQERSQLSKIKANNSGAGGAEAYEGYLMSAIDLTIANELLKFKDIKIKPVESDNPTDIARIGVSMINQTKSVIIDFETMNLYITLF